MKILFLGYNNKETKLINFLKKSGHSVVHSKEEIDDFSFFDLVISFGYKFIVKKTYLETLKRPILNLHISYLPFNKGAHPNFWSHFNNTPSGVSIHEIDSGIDTGPIAFQKIVNLDEAYTLKESYKILLKEIEDLFINNFKEIEDFNYKKITPNEFGTFHKKSELPEWASWDMTINEIKKKSIEERQCFVVLGNLMHQSGDLNEESKLRVKKLIEIVKDRRDQDIFFCGWDYRDDSEKTIAEALKEYFQSNCEASQNFFLSDLSRDTVGDAIFLRKIFQDKIGNKRVNVVTSDYHSSRSRNIFKYVFGEKNDVQVFSARSSKKDSQKQNEKDSYQSFLRTFQGIDAGNLEEIYKRLITSHPYYNGDIYKELTLEK